MKKSATFSIICVVGVFFMVTALHYIPTQYIMLPNISEDSRQNSEIFVSVSPSREVMVATTSNISANLSEIRPEEVGFDISRIELIQRQRQNQLREGCEQRFNHSAEEGGLGAAGFDNGVKNTVIVYNDIHNVMMCMMPKVGTTTWKRNVFLPLDPNFAKFSPSRQAYLMSGQNPHLHKYTTLKQIAKSNSSALKSMFQDYYSFVFVREPLEHLLSAFMDKFVHPVNRTNNVQFKPTAQYIYRITHPKIFEGLSKAESTAILERITVFSVTFPEFVQAWVTQDRRVTDRHWDRYTRVCRPCELPYKYIGHYETLADDSAYIVNYATDLHEFISFPEVYTSGTRTRMYEMYSRVPVDDIIALGEIYKDDYELFGYSFKDIFDELMEHRNETVSA